MINIQKKSAILQLAHINTSKSEIARQLNISRNTVINCIKKQEALEKKLQQADPHSREYYELLEQVAGNFEHSSKNQPRKRTKRTPELEERIDQILADETRKDKTYGAKHKLSRTAKSIHEQLKEEGFDASLSLVNMIVREKKDKMREVFIKQEYDYGDRGEFDYGERTITIGGKLQKVFLAVAGLPKSGYRDVYVYKHKDMESFMDAMVRFFDRLGGNPRRMVFDNMKNVVKRFVGPNEKELTDQVCALSNYYNHFKVDLTNTYAGNEKGFIESSVKVIARELFSKKDQFESFEEVVEYVREEKKKFIPKGDFEAEQKALEAKKAPYEYARIIEAKVNKYGLVRVEKNDYSVPEDYIGKTVTVKIYPLKILIYQRGVCIASHTRLDGPGESSIQLQHYLKTMLKKPKALESSVALKQVPELYQIYKDYYSQSPREFLAKLYDNKDKLSIDELIGLLKPGEDFIPETNALEEKSTEQLGDIRSMFNGGLNESDL